MVMRLHPMIEFARLLNETDSLFSNATNNGRDSSVVRPLVDLYDSGDHLVFRALVPGIRPDSLDVTIEQNTLHINGQYGYEMDQDEMKDVTWYRREIGSGRFSHSITLPVPVDSEQIDARFEDGILFLDMPKAQHARVKRIEVQAPKALTGSPN